MVAALIYILLLALWSAVVAYGILFMLVPRMGKKSHSHGHAAHAPAPPKPAHYARPTRDYSTHEGFKSLANKEELTIEDIVKGLSRDKR